MHHAYQYVVLRYVHDVVAQEFINVGVVLFAPDARLIHGRFATDYRRLRAAFSDVDEAHLAATLEYLGVSFAQMVIPSSATTRDIHHLVRQVLPADDSSLQWSPAGSGLTDDCSRTLDQLFHRFVARQPQAATAST